MVSYRDVDDLIDRRPGKELLTPVVDDPAHAITPFLFRSGGTTAAYMLVSPAGRIIVNTGMGFEAIHHRRVFDAVCPGPTPYIVTTQAHVDHVSGVARFREPETVYVAQERNQDCQRDDARIARLRASTAGIWFPGVMQRIREVMEANPGEDIFPPSPVPDLTFSDRHELTVGDLDLELISTPGGETVDACVVWLPRHRIAMVSNLFGPLFPHFPNLNTLRGDKYRFVEPYLEAVETVRALRPEMLVTGRYTPVEGADLIDAALARLHAAVDHVHRETLRRMNAGEDLLSIVRAVSLPSELRVGEGYGKVEWAVRTIWESYTGWFRRESTSELYPVDWRDAVADLVAIAGARAALDRARERLRTGAPVAAIHLAEAVLAHEPGHRDAAAVMVEAHDALLAAGGDVSFWESGWLRHERARWAELA
jgi:glyoxylase-like metal-dependent hydrolase (beta-lactamase superfamily II)